MKSRAYRTFATYLFLFSLLFSATGGVANAQSKPQKPDPNTGGGKKNTRPTPPTEEELKKAEEERKIREEEKNAIFDDTIEKVETNVVAVDAVVLNKKTGQIISGLNKANFAIFENGVKQNISSFATPDSPITVTLVVEYSKWTEILGSAGGGQFDPGTYEVIRPVAQFMTNFIKPPNDYASVIAYDIRPTPITDFTNDPGRIRATIDLLLRNRPAFRENAMFDALKLALVGGRADSVVLEKSKEEKSDYAGMVAVKSKRKAIILVASGIDTFSKIGYDEARRIIQEAGVPIYIISTGNLFYKMYEGRLGATDDLSGGPGRLTFLMAQNIMNTLARESGGRHFPMTFEAEVPSYLQSINALMRSQYSLTYDLAEKKPPGTRSKIEVKVDVDGDGVYDDKVYQVQHRPFYVTPGGGKPEKEKKKK
ncbi:MAG TPA: VWA domain-containing protein [Pyrinomonadaceae bacterium]|nr:VWA domain-containing protein [Chloracidobacterium sp.]MBP9935290.1 VWA domain-containing protein [Pyrinomonadaceae bacterium]MBL0240485.1 VWA domain-containing protein [Chloracidobacterium sp.]HQX56642.1 VWA domain-containing protein [Pyrinomonadaceae bacterium]HQY67264.1 VWA domain-containing protein [Pyrinomonadaceae bacterium]